MLQMLQVLMIAGMLLVSSHSLANSFPQALKTILHQQTDPSNQGEEFVRLSQTSQLIDFYQQRDYQPAWITDYRTLSLITQLLNALSQAETDGLNSNDSRYHKSHILQLADSQSLAGLVKLELLLSDSFMTLGMHIHYGAAYQTEADTLYRVFKRRPINLPRVLDHAIKEGQIESALANLAPSHHRYQNLKKALHVYKSIANQGGWNTDPDNYLDFEQVKSRLTITGEYNPQPQPCPTPLLEDIEQTYIAWSWSQPEPNTVPQDPYLAAAIKRFQQQQNLKVDGIVGPKTRQRLAESVHLIIERIKLNLERWRWFNPIEENHYVMVNIADFSLQYLRDDQTLSMRAVVGQTRRQTPMMQAKMSHMVINPFWRIPKTILSEDILPKLRKNSDYLNSKQIRLFSSRDSAEKHKLDATSIDWNQVTSNSILRYTFRQDAGPSNPLGTIKFMFPNGEDIYIHDTSARYLFQNKTFLVSSGCIRAEKPLEFAYDILVREQPDISQQAVSEMIKSGQRKVIWLKEKIPVYLTYQTAWADENGILYQRKDVYQHDQNLLNFLKNNQKNTH